MSSSTTKSDIRLIIMMVNIEFYLLLSNYEIFSQNITLYIIIYQLKRVHDVQARFNY